MELVFHEIFWGVNADLATRFCNRTLALPVTQQATGGEYADIRKAAKLFVGNVDVNSGQMGSTDPMSELKEGVGQSLLRSSSGNPRMAVGIGGKIVHRDAKRIL